MKRQLKKLLGKTFAPGTLLYNAYHKSRGILAATTSGFPSSKMITIGVTGTNGKTATSIMLAHILEAAGEKVGLITTVSFWIADKKWVNETKMTTDTPFKTQRLLRQMVKAGCRFAIVETSSHALMQYRTWGIFYDVAVFTNLSQDHLDYHGTMENYRDTKARLFKELYDSPRIYHIPKIMVLNYDDPIHSHFGKFEADIRIGFTTKQDLPDSLKAGNIHTEPTHSTFTIFSSEGSVDIKLNVPGRFNIENAMAAASTAFALGLGLEKIKNGLESIIKIPGRMEYIDEGQPFTVISDYAHTPDGYDKALSSIRSFTKSKLIIVFGAAGDRDKDKRPQLGRIASQYGDILILTEEDPASEDPAKIINEIKAGISDKFIEGENMFTILDRKKAVQKAFELAQPNDTVALLALGAQTIITTKAGAIPYNERQYARNLLQLAVGETNSHPGLASGSGEPPSRAEPLL